MFTGPTWCCTSPRPTISTGFLGMASLCSRKGDRQETRRAINELVDSDEPELLPLATMAWARGFFAPWNDPRVLEALSYAATSVGIVRTCREKLKRT